MGVQQEVREGALSAAVVAVRYLAPRVVPNAEGFEAALSIAPSSLFSPQVSDPNKKNRWLAVPLLIFQVFVLRPVLIAQMKKDGEPGESD